MCTKLISFVCFFYGVLFSLQAQKTSTVYLNLSDSSTQYYIQLSPEKGLHKGILVLLPGFGETPQNVLVQSNLPYTSASQGLLTIIPVLKTGVRGFGIDSLSQQSLGELLQQLCATAPALPLYIGGFSIGGAAAIKYTEIAQQQANWPKPKAVFAIDPPLDFERFYQNCLRHIRINRGQATSQEVLYMKKRIEYEMGGTPASHWLAFQKMSPYTFSDTSQTAIQLLLNTPVRLYTEPDVEWWLQERGSDLYGMNALDATCMVNELRHLGHPNAYLISTDHKGFRNPDKRRHPHSWSIVEPLELINWLWTFQ